jgi:chaperonin cofactor prefoldin
MLTTYGGDSSVKTNESSIESQLRTRCHILESQIDVLKKQVENQVVMIDNLEKLNKNNEDLPPGYHL